MNKNPLTHLSRRRFIANASLAALAAANRRAFALPDAPNLIVQTPCGALQGAREAGVRVFRGVPFAQPPTGPFRFLPPRKLAAWTGLRDATAFAAAAIQPGADHAQSEDCLYLNVWTPEPTPTQAPLPVFVWIHGGALMTGESFAPILNGAQFASEGVVVVTVAYRLGVLGFLDYGPLLGQAYAQTANNGLCDVIAALEWVQQNIAAFGGDPARVTVGGESAGAKLTAMLMGAPSASPLFHQMISESGGPDRVYPTAKSAEIAKSFGESWTATSTRTLDDLKTAPPGALIDAQVEFLKRWPGHFPLRGESGTKLLPQMPLNAVTAGSTRGKRLLLGTNRDESALFAGPHPDHDAESRDLATLSVAEFAAIYANYGKVYPRLTEAQRRIRALTAEEYWISSMQLAAAHVKSGGEAFVYELEFAETSGRFAGLAFHSLDLPLVWDKPHATVANAADEAELAHRVHHAWLTFIRGETPHAEGLPTWPAYATPSRPTMIFNVASRIESQPQQAELELWDKVQWPFTAH